MKKEKNPPFEVALKIHHRLVWIHPFENGNGRWARMIANIYLHLKKLPIIAWPGDLAFRKSYIEALRQADSGNPAPLTGLLRPFWNVQA